MIIPMLCVTIFVILVVWFLLPRVARLMIHTPTAISIFVCLSMVQLMAVFISMRCTLCGHFLQVALTLILVVGYAIAASYIACKIRGLMVTVCPSQFATRRTLFHVLVGCGLLMLKVSRLKLPVIWLSVSMWLNPFTECLIQHTKLGYDATPFNQILKQNAKREMRLRLGKVTVADVLAAQPVTTNLL